SQMRSASFRWERNETPSRHSRPCSFACDCASIQPKLLHVLQHGKGNFSRRATGYQQGGGCPLGSAPFLYDPRCLGSISLWEEARSRASSIVWIRRFNLGVGENQ